MKLGIIGVGRVGSQILTDVQYLNIFHEIVLIDNNQSVIKGEASDHLHFQGLSDTNRIRITAGDYSDLQNSDIIVITASAKTDVSMADRTELAKTNADIMIEIVNEIKKVTTDTIIIVVSNPVDAMTYLISQHYPHDKVIGTGTFLETTRFKTLIGHHYEVDPKSVEAFVIGEHGAHNVPVWSKVRVFGMTLYEFEQLSKKKPINKEKTTTLIDEISYDVFHNKGWTNAAISRVVTKLIKSLLLDERSIYPLTTIEQNIAYSLPVLTGKEGIIARYHIELDETEVSKLNVSKCFIESTIKNIL